MAISEADLTIFKEKVLAAKRPLFFHDDDADGLCSYLLCYRARGGNGYGTRAKHFVTADNSVRKVEENAPDLVVVLDCAGIEPEFFEHVKVPILWLDHHEPARDLPAHVTYLNPRLDDDADNRCTTYWVYRALGRAEDLWMGAVGSVSDWQMTEVGKAFSEARPDILPVTTSAPDALYCEPFCTLCRLFQYNLKGDSADVRTAIKILSRIETPDELLAHTTPRAKLLWKRYQHVDREYMTLLVDARKSATKNPEDKILLHVFPELAISLVSEVSNQLIHEFPDRIIFLARDHQGEHKLSVRSTEADVASAIKQALAETGARGNAGGHKHACGGRINNDDFPKFYAAFRKALGLDS